MSTGAGPGIDTTNGAAAAPLAGEELEAAKEAAKEQLEALCQALLLPVPILVAISAALLANGETITVIGGEFTLPIGLVAARMAIALILLNCLRLTVWLGRTCRRAGDPSSVFGALQADPATLNPFFKLPTTKGTPQAAREDDRKLLDLLCFLPGASTALILGFAASFGLMIYPQCLVPFGFWLVSTVFLVTGAAFTAIMLIRILNEFGRNWGWRVRVITGSWLLGFALGVGADWAIQSHRAASPVEQAECPEGCAALSGLLVRFSEDYAVTCVPGAPSAQDAPDE